MTTVDRRSTLALGLAVMPALVSTKAMPTVAYGPDAGAEVAPGVREVFLRERAIGLPAYKRIWMTDLVFQPGAATPPDLVPNDRICLIAEGLLRVRLEEKEFVIKKGDLWASPKGATERRANTGADVAVARIIDLLPW